MNTSGHPDAPAPAPGEGGSAKSDEGTAGSSGAEAPADRIAASLAPGSVAARWHRLIGQRPWLTWALVVLAGLAQALSIAPVPLPALQLVGMAGLVLALHGTLPRRAALLGWAFGVVWLGVAVWWLFISMHRYGELPAWLAAAAVLALAGCLSLYLALVCWAWACCCGRGGLVHDTLQFAALWLMAELARAQWLTGFPWAASGYAHVDGLLALAAPWLGVYGMGGLAAALAAGSTGYWLRRQLPMARPWRAGALTLIALGLLQMWSPRGPDFSASAGRLTVTLLQGNVAQDQKFDPALLPASLAWHDRALRAATTDLVLAPETAVPLLPQDLPGGYWDDLRQHFEHGPVAALFGVPLGEAASGYTNSAVGLSATARAYRYDKHHLVPFGEFIPLGFHWFVDLMNMPLGDFNRGALVQPSFIVRGLRVAPNICYEDLFGEELAARFVDPVQAPEVLANLSNIGWFGESYAVAQHLHISRMRTLELQRPMLRATNTGATVVIDHRGRVRHALAPHQVGVLVGEVEGRTGVTPFAAWAGRWGLWPLWLLALALVLACVHAGRRQGSAAA